MQDRVMLLRSSGISEQTKVKLQCMNNVTYYLKRKDVIDPELEFEKIISKLRALNYPQINCVDKHLVELSYVDQPHRVSIKLITTQNTRNLTSNGFTVTLQISRLDNSSMNLFRHIGSLLGYKIFNPGLNSYLPTDKDLLDASAGQVYFSDTINTKVNTILKNRGFTILFIFFKSLLCYARSEKDGSMHIVNPALLYYFIDFEDNNPQEAVSEFSYKVAPDLTLFVAMYNEALIPRSFYEYYRKDVTIINFSGFDICNPGRKIFVKPVVYIYVKENQEFVPFASSQSALTFADKIRPGENLHTTIQRILKDEFKTDGVYIGATAYRNIEFDRDRHGVLTPRLTVAIYVDEITRDFTLQQKTKRSWISREEADTKAG